MISCCIRMAARVVFAIAFAPLSALAHGIGERYDLPVPLWLWLTGGGIAIAASFVVASFAMKSASTQPESERSHASPSRLAGILTSVWLRSAARLCAVILLLLVVTAGLFGDQTPTRNIAPIMVWVIWWVGFAYLSALVGDVWSAINPWAALFAAFEKMLGAFGLRLHPRLYPTRLGVWPAVLLYAAFSWIELVYDSRAVPVRLAMLIAGYSVITWMGMLIYGHDAWLKNGDPFSVAFRTLARFAPTEVKHEGTGAKSTLSVRSFGSGLIASDSVSTSMLVFVTLLLSTVTFDGFLATPAWNAMEGFLFRHASALDQYRLMVINSFGLLVFWCAFLGMYLLFARWMARASGGALSTDAAARLFVISLVPIAIGYHIAHYLTYLLTQGQLVIRLASDPFGFGWNLFGTARYRPNYEVVGARFAWYTAVLAIVIGHMYAVYVAHRIAFREIPDRRKALGSQIPMLFLMIGYTMLSLWIIAQPVTESGQS